MDCKEYLERLCWQKLVRDKIFKKFLETKDLELILDLEKKYQEFGLKIWVSKGLENEAIAENKHPQGQPFRDEIFWSYHPSPVKILTEAHANKLVFQIDLEMFQYTNDIGSVTKEIEEKLKFEVKSRQGDLAEKINKAIKMIENDSEDELESIKEILALKFIKEDDTPDAIMGEHARKDFDRDLEILAFWEKLPNRPFKDISEEFGISVDTAQKSLNRIHRLIYEEPYTPKPKPKLKDESLSKLCDECPIEKKAKCAEMCSELKSFLESEIKGKLWGEVPGTHTQEDENRNKGLYNQDALNGPFPDRH